MLYEYKGLSIQTGITSHLGLINNYQSNRTRGLYFCCRNKYNTVGNAWTPTPLCHNNFFGHTCVSVFWEGRFQNVWPIFEQGRLFDLFGLYTFTLDHLFCWFYSQGSQFLVIIVRFMQVR